MREQKVVYSVENPFLKLGGARGYIMPLIRSFKQPFQHVSMPKGSVKGHPKDNMYCFLICKIVETKSDQHWFFFKLLIVAYILDIDIDTNLSYSST